MSEDEKAVEAASSQLPPLEDAYAQILSDHGNAIIGVSVTLMEVLGRLAQLEEKVNGRSES